MRKSVQNRPAAAPFTITSFLFGSFSLSCRGVEQKSIHSFLIHKYRRRTYRPRIYGININLPSPGNPKRIAQLVERICDDRFTARSKSYSLPNTVVFSTVFSESFLDFSLLVICIMQQSMNNKKIKLHLQIIWYRFIFRMIIVMMKTITIIKIDK